jgi:hypothetical protein
MKKPSEPLKLELPGWVLSTFNDHEANAEERARAKAELDLIIEEVLKKEKEKEA